MRCGAYYGASFSSSSSGNESVRRPAACIALHWLISIHTQSGGASQKGAARTKANGLTEAGMGGGSSRVRNVPFGQNSFGICGIDSTVAQVQSPLPQSISKERKAPRLA